MPNKKTLSKPTKTANKKTNPSQKKKEPKRGAKKLASPVEKTGGKKVASAAGKPQLNGKNGHALRKLDLRLVLGAAGKTIPAGKGTTGTKIVTAISVIDQPDVQEKLR